MQNKAVQEEEGEGHKKDKRNTENQEYKASGNPTSSTTTLNVNGLQHAS